MATHIAEIFDKSAAGGIFMVLFLAGMTMLLTVFSRKKGYIEPATWVFYALDAYMCLPVEHLRLLQILILFFGLFMLWAGYRWGIIIPIFKSGKKFYQSPGKIVLALLVVGLPGFAVSQGIWTQLHPVCEYGNCKVSICEDSEHYCEFHSFLDDHETYSSALESSGKGTAVKQTGLGSSAGSYESNGSKCMSRGCDRTRMYGSMYCVLHTCAKGGCFKESYSGNFCKEHCPASYTKSKEKSRDPKDYDIEGYYDDNRSDYDDYDDAYEGFEDDPDEWDYYD